MNMLFRRRKLPPEEKERRRFYLLPGMGGRAFHRKQRRFRNAAIIVGVLVSALVGLAMWYLNKTPGK